MNDSENVSKNLQDSTSSLSGSAFVPAAIRQPRQRISLLWILPALAVVFVVWVGVRAWDQRGLLIGVQLEQGHGLKAGDPVRYRGAAIGQVESIDVDPDLQGLTAQVRLHSQAQQIARAGTQFWVVRPQMRITRVQGLETLIGPRYLAVTPPYDPPNASPDSSAASAKTYAPLQRTFIALREPPVVERIDPDDLEVIVVADQRGSLHAGAPVLYRQTQVGTVLSVGLASDAGSVEARLHIQKPFVPLIRPETRFWDAGGVQAKLGFTGLTIDVESAEALLSGGVALATPPTQTPQPATASSAPHTPESGVRTGHRFVLASKAEDEWLKWKPTIALGDSLLPVGAVKPSPLRASLTWTQGRLISRERTRTGWVLQTSAGLLGPADILMPPESQGNTAVLEVAGELLPLKHPPAWEGNGLALVQSPAFGPRWPADLLRTAEAPEDCVAIADLSMEPLPLSASRMKSESPTWRIDSAVPLDESWHGACVIARNDGKLVGLLLVEKSRGSSGRVALFPQLPELLRK